MKKIIAIFLCLISFALCTSSVTAHSELTGYQHDSSVTGWDIYETSKHWSSSKGMLTVNCGDFVGEDFEDWIVDAVQDWNSATFNGSDLISMQINNSTGCVIFYNKSAAQMMTEFNKSAWGIAYRSKASADSDNHYLTTAGNVEIWVNWSGTLINKSDRAKLHVPLHELGHIIGLIDIPSSVSPNAYLMCNGFGTSYSVPNTITSNDKQGAAVILGQHTTHTFAYAQYSSTSHKHYCTICGIYEYSSHIPSLQGTSCIRCGYVY